MRARFGLIVLVFLVGLTSSFGAVYEVGPGKALTSLFGVPWKSLQPGDVVNIYPKPGGYKEKIQISGSGTAAQHIVIRGIPDPSTGALPVLEANGAVEDPSTDWRSPVLSDFGMITVSPRKANYVYGSTHVSFVDIEGLEIRNCIYTTDKSITYTDQFGQVRGYDGFSCGIYIEWARDFTVRGCDIHHCGNGLFANSKNGNAQSSARLLIEKNYFHDNSLKATVDPVSGATISNGYHEHHIYTESVGVTIQYNKFGPLLPDAHGVAIKDRSSGEVIRYNEFDMAEQSNVLALLDPQGGAGFIELQPDYRDSYVYGNLITIENYASGISLFWWGAYNGASSYAAEHRGTLYFYNNTVVIHHYRAALFFLPSTDYVGSAPVQEVVDCRNNIFYVDPAGQTNPYDALTWFTGGATNGGGAINLGVNWVSPGIQKDAPFHGYGGALNGVNNLIVGDGTGANNAHFVDMNAHDYHAANGANTVDAAGPLSSAVLPAYDDVLEYLAPQSFKQRVQVGARMDLGALESGGVGTPAPTPARCLNISTRGKVEGGNSVLIGGLIVSGTQSKKVLIRAIGPSLAAAQIASPLLDPILELHLADGSIITNDDWKNSQRLEIEATTLAPANDKESAIVVMLPPGAHTAIVQGTNQSKGTAVIEAYDLEAATPSVLANISTRGFVGNGNDVLIGGFILGGTAGTPQIVIRGLGPSLVASGIFDAISDPTLTITNQNGATVASNDNWQEDAANAATLTSNGFAPKAAAESAVVLQMSPGSYTAILASKTGAPGVGLVEIYNLR
ncbi:MAG TPA: hypothetical protein VGW57_06660 [Chthoniobacterales bacterium]|nr:hypothetical protein [Chthoniobacterales bacterium]